jgi:1,2-phenylacetyl-CoA epoxidase catalytic subunit
MATRQARIPEPFHRAVEKWRDTFIPDFDLLMEDWEKYFPKDPRFELCAFRELGICDEIECGELQGRPKAHRPEDLLPEQAQHLLGAIKAQASTEFGSIQQHMHTLARAQTERDQFWVLRMMAEELRHGYQMLHLLLDGDWNKVADVKGADMVEEILSMTTGSHVLGAFNIDFDSFVDNITFCCLIDRVGKYQLDMQRISAYITTGDIQSAINKWLPRGLEMFGDERGGGTNVRYGLKPMKNREAQDLYYHEVEKVVRDLNMRYLRARLPELHLAEAEELLDRVLADGTAVRGIAWEDLLHLPVKEFFRRRGEPAFRMVGWRGEEYDDAEAYLRHLQETLPASYRANRDFRSYGEALRRVATGEVSADEASREMPSLRRIGGTCPCSRSVRWVVDEVPSNGEKRLASIEQPVA